MLRRIALATMMVVIAVGVVTAAPAAKAGAAAPVQNLDINGPAPGESATTWINGTLNTQLLQAWINAGEPARPPIAKIIAEADADALKGNGVTGMLPTGTDLTEVNSPLGDQAALNTAQATSNVGSANSALAQAAASLPWTGKVYHYTIGCADFCDWAEQFYVPRLVDGAWVETFVTPSSDCYASSTLPGAAVNQTFCGVPAGYPNPAGYGVCAYFEAPYPNCNSFVLVRDQFEVYIGFSIFHLTYHYWYWADFNGNGSYTDGCSECVQFYDG